MKIEEIFHNNPYLASETKKSIRRNISIRYRKYTISNIKNNLNKYGN